MKLAGLISVTDWLWILIHGLLVALGVIFLSAPWFTAYFGQAIAQGIGGSLVATGIAGEVLFLHVRLSERTREQLEMLSDAGLRKVYQYRSVRIREEYDERFTAAKEIDLVAYGLSSFRQDYSDQFAAWSMRARVRILLLDPSFPTTATSLADQRDREEGHDVGQTRSDIEKFEKVVREAVGLNRSNFHLRRFRSIPAINLLRIDHEIFWGPYLYGVQSRNTPTLRVRRGGFLFSALDSHFEELWKTAEDIAV